MNQEESERNEVDGMKNVDSSSGLVQVKFRVDERQHLLQN